MDVQTFFDPQTWTLTYLVSDPVSQDAVIIDPVLDYDPIGLRTSEKSVDHVLAAVKAQNLHLRAVLETHAHADHISAADHLRGATGVPVAIGERITAVQSVFKGLFNLKEFSPDGHQFDHLLTDGEVWQVGTISIKAIATPGHTPACMSYLIGDTLFTGDALFMPDYGTGRCDFPGGSASDLYNSIQKLYQLPDETRVFVGHDYQPQGRELKWQTTIGESKVANIQLKAYTSREDFVHFRTTRDKTLKLPTLLFQSLQCNIAAGALPTPDENGHRFLKLPLNRL